MPVTGGVIAGRPAPYSLTTGESRSHEMCLGNATRRERGQVVLKGQREVDLVIANAHE